jgi:predicted GNAT family acetyltransferase
MNIRKATKEDIITVSALWALLVYEVFLGKRKPDIGYWQNFIANMMDYDETYAMYVVEINNEVVGFTDFIIQYDPTMSKWMLNSFQTYVLPNYRKSGATKALWKKLVSDAKTNKCEVIFFATDPGKYVYWKDLIGAELSEICMAVNTADLKEV